MYLMAKERVHTENSASKRSTEGQKKVRTWDEKAPLPSQHIITTVQELCWVLLRINKGLESLEQEFT